MWHRAQETHEERIYEPAQLTAMLEQAVIPRSKLMATSPLRPYRAAEDRIYLHEREINL